MKNILIVLPDDRLGGSEQVLRNISLHHLNKNDSVHVVFFKKPLSGQWADLETYKNFKSYYTSSKRDLTGIPFAFLNLLKLKKTFYRIYTSHLHTTSFVGLMAKSGIIKKICFIGRESTSYFLRYKGIRLGVFKILYKIGYSSIDLLICQSDLMKNQLINGLPALTSKLNIRVIPNPINLEILKDQQENNESNLCKNEFIVSAGRLIWEKGYDILIESFIKLKEDYPDLKLIILGEGICRSEIEALISSSDLNNDVLLKGHVADVYSYFREAKLCVVSSRFEGFPNVLLQMMSQNSRIVSTKCAGGIEELQGIVTANTNDSQDLYKKIKLALNMDVSQNRELFKKQLEERSLDNFFRKVDTNLMDKT